MKKQDIEKNRDELFEAIPKLRNVYKKAFNYIFIIKLIICTLLPVISLIIIPFTPPNWFFKNNYRISLFWIILITDFCLLFSSILHFADFIWRFLLIYKNDNKIKWLRTRAIKDWEKYYDNILMPLYEMKEKKLAIESLAEAGLLFTRNINFNKLSIIDHIAIGLELKNKRNWLLVFIPLWQFLGGENYQTWFWNGQKHKTIKSYFNERYLLNVSNYFYIDVPWARVYKVLFLTKETEERLLKYIKNKKKK